MHTREILLSVAEEQIGARGLSGVSFGDLAKAIGIRKASVHHHFASKDVMIVALVERFRSAYATALAGLDAAHGDAAARLCAFIMMRRKVLTGSRHRHLPLALMADRAELPGQARAGLARCDRDEHVWLADAFRMAAGQGLALVAPPAKEAAQMQAIVTGAEALAYLHDYIALFDSAVAPLRERLS